MSEELNQATQNLALDEKTQSAGSTVITDNHKPEYKHPLNSGWTLWYTKPQADKSESWSDLLKPIITFHSVEEFWGIYNSIPQPSELPLKADYHLFREGIKPEWEDVANSNGGKFNYAFQDRKNTSLNDIWLRACLALIGETIQDDEEEVNGIVVSIRSFAYKVALWTKSTQKVKLFPIGEKFKKVLTLPDSELIEFFDHKDSDTRGAKPVMMI